MAIINGTGGNDFLNGGDAADTIYGYGGTDEIKGGKGADWIDGGDDNDKIDAGEGNNRIYGGLGNDDIFAVGEGSNTIYGGGGNDVLGGGIGNDTLYGEDGDDVFFRANGSDLIYGGAGNDTYEGGASDTVYGGGGADVFLFEGFNPANIRVSGGGGRDRYVLLEDPGPYTNPVYVITDFEEGPGGDVLDLDALLEASGANGGYEGGNPFNPSIGIFRLVQSGAHVLVQWNINAHLDVKEWKTVFTLQNTSAGALTADNFNGGIPPDGSPVPGSSQAGLDGADSLQGGFFNDTLDGAAGDDLLEGRGGNDSIVGGSGNDTINGGSGGDRLSGNEGDDVFIVGSAGTGTVATGGAGVDTYQLDIGFLRESRGYVVTDFAAGAGGDLIDVNPLLYVSTIPYGAGPLKMGYTGGNPFDPEVGFLRLAQSGDDVKLQWDPDGPDDSRAGWQTVLTLKNRDVSDITSDNFISWISPQGTVEPGRTIEGTTGDDRLMGSVFDDEITGDAGNDRLVGNAGDDYMDAGDGQDSVAGGLGNDTVLGGNGNDWFNDPRADQPASFGDDWLYGGDGDDEFYDAFGNNRFFGGAGRDSFNLADHGIYRTGADTITGGADSDVVHVLTSAVARKDAVTDFQTGAGGDQLSVSGAFFHPDSDSFRLGFLRLLQSGSHTLLQWDRDGSTGTQFGPVTLLTLRNVTATAITSDNFLGELVVGTNGNDDLTGGLGNDTVQGLGGNDTLNGSLGKDQLEGGFGNDLYFVDNALDVVTEDSNDPPGGLVWRGPGAGAAVSGITDTVNAAVNYSLGQYLEHLRLSGSAKIGNGNELANSIAGNTKANLIAGNGGADTLNGGAGNDTLDGGAGADRANGGTGDDVIAWGAGDKRLDGSTGTDTLKVADGVLDLTGVGQTVIVNVEQVDLRGEATGLVLTAQDVLDMSATDTVTVLGDAADVVDVTGLARNGSVGALHRYTGGGATLLVESDLTVV